MFNVYKKQNKSRCQQKFQAKLSEVFKFIKKKE